MGPPTGFIAWKATSASSVTGILWTRSTRVRSINRRGKGFHAGERGRYTGGMPPEDSKPTPPVAKPLLFTSPIFLEHDTGDHPECIERLRHLGERLKTAPVVEKYQPGKVLAAQAQQLELVHTPAHIQSIRRQAETGGGRIEADTVMSARSYEVACHAVGASLAAVDAVVTSAAPRAVCLVRPPGHHALVDAPMGFCLFNNVALAAAHARKQHKLGKVLIVDWDVHHGNGTQDIFYRDENVFFFSAHRSPFYPGTGAANETGAGPGVGTKFNLPVRFGTHRKAYREGFQTMLEQAAAKCRPDLVLISAGFDAHAADPIGSLGLETEDFATLTKLVCQVADQYCQGRVVSLLEGGYNIKMLADSVICHLENFA
jgi:acetoin utilization deacetylase AcuC-like enzyme